MASHKHGVYSFTVQIGRMKAIGGDEYVAEITQFRRHDRTGAAIDLEPPNLPEQYGETASEAEGNCVAVMHDWLAVNGRADRAVASLAARRRFEPTRYSRP